MEQLLVVSPYPKLSSVGTTEAAVRPVPKPFQTKERDFDKDREMRKLRLMYLSIKLETPGFIHAVVADVK